MNKNLFTKGHVGYWLGKKHSLETKKKMSESQKRIGNRPPSPKGKDYVYYVIKAPYEKVEYKVEGVVVGSVYNRVQ